MQKLRPPTWRRSRTPTPVEMRTSLPSGSTTCGCTDSCGTLQLSRQASLNIASGPVEATSSITPTTSNLLLLPGNRARSRSFDCTTTSSSPNTPESPNQPASSSSHHNHTSGPLFGMLRRSFSRNSSAASEPASYRNELSMLGGGGTAGSSVSGSAVCIHCLCVEEYERLLLSETTTAEGGTITSSGGSGSLLEREAEEGEEQSGEYDDLLLLDDQDDHSSCESCNAAEGGPSSASAEQLRLSFLGESFECRQKVEPWIREQMMRDEHEHQGVFQHGLSRTVAPIRRGRSLGLAPQSSLGMMNDTQLRSDAHQLRRGGSECRPTTAEAAPPCLFNFSFNSSTGEPPSSYYQVSSPSCSLSGGRKSPAPPGTPRLERQEALCGSSAWFDQSSMDGLAVHRYQAASSMETHASASLEVDSGAYGIVHRTSIESQSSDVIVPQHNHHQRGRGSSLESDNSLESAGRGLLPSNPMLLEDVHQHPRSSSLLARRKCLSAGASPSSSPPCTKSAASSSGYPGRLNLSAAATGSSSEYGDAVISPSPPAEIYLTVPVLPALNASASSPSSKDVGFNRPSFLLRQRFRGRNDSSRSSSDSNNVFLNNAASAIVADSVSSSSKSRALSRSGDSLLHPRGAEGSRPHRSRSIEIGLPTAHHHHHRTEYHDLAGSARRQQWVSRLKYV